MLQLLHRYRRKLDIEILWPRCREHAPSLYQARLAFTVHAFNDPAWLCLGKTEIAKIIDRLE
jgi:hypothetical protein